jgi:hypothetical protein
VRVPSKTISILCSTIISQKPELGGERAFSKSIAVNIGSSEVETGLQDIVEYNSRNHKRSSKYQKAHLENSFIFENSYP